MNLFTMATTNVTALEHKLDAIKVSLTGAELDSLDRFVNYVLSEGHLAINMRQTPLLVFITTNNYQNTYEWANSQSVISGRPVDDILRQRLGIFYERRLTFDDSLERGREFRYGALITYGAGATNYGQYSVILKDNTPQNIELAYLRADSLKTYMISDSIVDSTSLQEDAATHTHRHILAGIKHHRQVPKTPDTSWATMLCSDSDFIEAIFIGRITANDLQEVRMLKSHYDKYFYRAFEDFRGKIDEMERAYIDGFASIIKLLRQSGIRLEVV